ncbi:MAG: NADH-quinone oxidoreductase subunit C [Desulfovibrio sp.]|jgi:NADH:ubiquinone oxidoreductase subunit C|nr:NADH-quinone oxidoreductase subunit C [Desulfovibrio sp.]
MQDTINGNQRIIDGLGQCSETGTVHHTVDSFGNAFHWFRLGTPRHLTRAAALLSETGARLCMVTAYNRRHLSEPMQEICYHFEVAGVIYNLTVILNGEWPVVPSITPFFANADWHEREMMELYGINVADHPNPRRLFLDESFERGILNQAVPLSIMMNGASTTDLWERILADREKQS